MGITNQEKRVFSTFSLSLRLHKASECKNTKAEPYVLPVLSFMRDGDEGEGRPTIILAPTPFTEGMWMDNMHAAIPALLLWP